MRQGIKTTTPSRNSYQNKANLKGSMDLEKNKSIPEERQSPSQVIEKIVEVPVEVIKYVKVEKIVEKIIYKPIDEMPIDREQTAEKIKEK